jgi:hypothetical protein
VTLTRAGLYDVSGQECGTAWICLITISHPELLPSIRITSDAVATISNSYLFSPFPFSIILPDDSDGTAPQAQFQIDNTSQEVIAVLRGLLTPPSLTIQIVRSENTNVIEREWQGLEWKTSQYDVGMITGTLSVDDLATEEFPYVTFDGRFKGLFS